MPTLGALLKEWETFYVIVGSSGGALTGLLFVVVALAAERIRGHRAPAALGAFNTPSLVHFVIVLFVAAMMTLPRRGVTGLSGCLALAGLAGLGTSIRAIVQIRRVTEYTAVAEDWLWYAALPTVAYAGLLVAAIALRRATDFALDTVAGVSIALLFIGIHNAWDSALYSTTMGVGHSPGDAPSRPLPELSRH
jgi:hypothetical protein